MRKYLKAETGVAAIEFAFIMPFLCFLFFGMVDLTGLIGFNRKITQSASIVADLVSQNVGGSPRNAFLKSSVTDYYKAVEMIMSPTAMTDVRVEVYGFRPSGATVTQEWATNNGGGAACGALPTAASLLPLTTAGNDLVVARVCVNYTPYIATFLGTKILGKTSFLVSETITQRPRSTAQLTCYQTTVAGAKCS